LYFGPETDRVQIVPIGEVFGLRLV
jgi:hypothetical protein